MKKIKLCFDAGHYTNYNRSNVYENYYEGNMTWELHLLVKEYLEKNYINVSIITTRSERDKDLSVYNRGYKAKGCDGFYSFHSNACDDKNVDRVVIIKGLGVKGVDNYAERLGEAIKKCMKLNSEVQVYEKSKENNQEFYGVLRGAKDAGVKDRYIIENSFHTNYNSAKWLCNINNLRVLAEEQAKEIADHHKLIKNINELNKIDNKKWSNGTYKVKVKTTSNLNLREGRGTNYPVVTTIKKGTVFELGYVLNNWGSTWNFENQALYFCCDYIEKL